MHILTGADLLIFARTLMLYPSLGRSTAAATMLVEADMACRHLRLFGQCDPAFGDGSLAARCHLLSPGPEPLADDREFLMAMITACQALLHHSKV